MTRRMWIFSSALAAFLWCLFAAAFYADGTSAGHSALLAIGVLFAAVLFAAVIIWGLSWAMRGGK